MADTHVAQGTKDPHYITRLKEVDKREKHADTASLAGLDFMPISGNTMGGIGREYWGFVTRHMELMRTEEILAGGTGRRTTGMTHYFLARISHAIQTSTAEMFLQLTGRGRRREEASDRQLAEAIHHTDA